MLSAAWDVYAVLFSHVLDVGGKGRSMLNEKIHVLYHTCFRDLQMDVRSAKVRVQVFPDVDWHGAPHRNSATLRLHNFEVLINIIIRHDQPSTPLTVASMAHHIPTQQSASQRLFYADGDREIDHPPA